MFSSLTGHISSICCFAGSTESLGFCLLRVPGARASWDPLDLMLYRLLELVQAFGTSLVHFVLELAPQVEIQGREVWGVR